MLIFNENLQKSRETDRGTSRSGGEPANRTVGKGEGVAGGGAGLDVQMECVGGQGVMVSISGFRVQEAEDVSSSK